MNESTVLALQALGQLVQHNVSMQSAAGDVIPSLITALRQAFSKPPESVPPADEAKTDASIVIRPPMYRLEWLNRADQQPAASRAEMLLQHEVPTYSQLVHLHVLRWCCCSPCLP